MKRKRVEQIQVRPILFDDITKIQEKTAKKKNKIKEFEFGNEIFKNDILKLQSRLEQVQTIQRKNTMRLKRYNHIFRDVCKLLKKHEKEYVRISGDNFLIGFKGRSNQWVIVDIRVFESAENMRGTKNSHRKHNNETHIGKGISQINDIVLNSVHQCIVYCTQLDPTHQFDTDIINGKKNININGGVVVDSLCQLQQVINFV